MQAERLLHWNISRKKKIKTFSADKEVKKILKRKIINNKIYKLFPEAFLGKKLNKTMLASIVFGDKNKLKKLEKIIHPLVGKEKKSFINKNKKEKIMILEIPLIFEKKTRKNYDFVILMNVNKKIQYKRAMKRENMTEQLLKKILSNQVSNLKKKYADYVIDSNGSKNETRQNLEKILEKIISTRL